jgi:hypothetical protein
MMNKSVFGLVDYVLNNVFFCLETKETKSQERRMFLPSLPEIRTTIEVVKKANQVLNKKRLCKCFLQTSSRLRCGSSFLTFTPTPARSPFIAGALFVPLFGMSAIIGKINFRSDYKSERLIAQMCAGMTKRRRVL